MQSMFHYQRPLARMSIAMVPMPWHFHVICHRRFRNKHKCFCDNNIHLYAAADERFGTFFSCIFISHFSGTPLSRFAFSKINKQSIKRFPIFKVKIFCFQRIVWIAHSVSLYPSIAVSLMRHKPCWNFSFTAQNSTSQRISRVAMDARRWQNKTNQKRFTCILAFRRHEAGLVVSVIVMLNIEETQTYRNYWRKCRANWWIE